MVDLNPFDDIGDWISDAIDAVRQVKKSGGVRNATRDVANRAATAGAGGGYAAPARVAASEAALKAYEKQAKTYKDIALLADSVLTGGISDPIARAAVGNITGDDALTKRALLDFAINAGLTIGGEKVGELAAKPLGKVLQGIDNLINREIGIHHSFTPGLNIIEPSGVRGQTTALDAMPGYTYFWSTRPGDNARDAVLMMKDGWNKIEKGLEVFGKDRKWVEGLLKSGYTTTPDEVNAQIFQAVALSADPSLAATVVPDFIKGLVRVAQATDNAPTGSMARGVAEGIPYQLDRIMDFKLPEDWWRGTAYIVDVPRNATTADENIIRNSASIAGRKILGPISRVVGEVNAPNTFDEVVENANRYRQAFGDAEYFRLGQENPMAFGNAVKPDIQEIVDAVRRAKIGRFTQAVPDSAMLQNAENRTMLAALLARLQAQGER